MRGNPNYIPPIPILQIRPGCLLCYSQRWTNPNRKEKSQIHTFDNDQAQRFYTGKMNEKAKSKLRFSINLLVEQAKWKEIQNPTTGKFYRFKINFITLTLSAKQREVSDRTIKNQMLAPWIRNMRDVYQLRSYVWRAERQKNGNIHFHFSTDSYIPYDAIRDSWNFQQSKFHFINEFRNRNKSEFPNSTDVHSVQSISNLASYMVKYMCKDEKGLESIEGKVWDCSKNLKTKERVALVMGEKDFNLINKLYDRFQTRVKNTDECTIIPMSKAEMRQYLPRSYMTDYENWIQSVYDAAPVSRAKRINL